MSSEHDTERRTTSFVSPLRGWPRSPSCRRRATCPRPYPSRPASKNSRDDRDGPHQQSAAEVSPQGKQRGARSDTPRRTSWAATGSKWAIRSARHKAEMATREGHRIASSTQRGKTLCSSPASRFCFLRFMRSCMSSHARRSSSLILPTFLISCPSSVPSMLRRTRQKNRKRRMRTRHGVTARRQDFCKACTDSKRGRYSSRGKPASPQQPHANRTSAAGREEARSTRVQ